MQSGLTMFLIRFARLSILFSIMRIDPSEKNRKRLFGVAGLFALTLAVLVAQVFWTCVPDQTWRDKIQPQCILPTQVGILQIISKLSALFYFMIRLSMHYLLLASRYLLRCDIIGTAAQALPGYLRQNSAPTSDVHLLNCHCNDNRCNGSLRLHLKTWGREDIVRRHCRGV